VAGGGRSLGDPILGDGVVVLRPPAELDLDGIDAGIHDPSVIRWLGRPTGTAQEVLELNRARAADGSPTFAILDRADRFLGLAWMNRSATEASTGSIGYWLLPAARGQGHATRAVRLLADHADRDLGLHQVLLITERANRRSRRVAERAGFEHIETRPGHHEIDGRAVDVAVYALPAHEP
jgi:RimJ/RimL family protein N-acetyltransferase